jgi:hypothetical protein
MYPYSPAQMPGYSQYTPQMPPMPSQTAQVVQSPQEKPQIQNGGFVCLRSIEEAKNYPVAPGNSITFKIENSPYLCTKTMGFSQLDQPHFEKYRLVKEEETEEPTPQNDHPDYALKSEFEELRERLNKVEKELKEVSGV